MSVDTSERLEHKPSFAGSIVDAARQTGHLSHQAQAVRSLAEDMTDDLVRGAKRAVRRGSEQLEDIRDEGVHYVKRHPLTTVALAAGIGFILGLTTSAIVWRLSGTD